MTCAIKVWLVPGFSQTNLGYFKNIVFNWNENKIEINFIFWLVLCFKCLFDPGMTIEIRQVHKRFIKLPITTIILDKEKRNWVFGTNSNLLIPMYLHPYGVNLWFRLLDLADFIVWNAKGIKHWVAKILIYQKIGICG